VQEWVAGAELAATFVLTRRDGGPHEAIPVGRARAGADPQWRQALSLYVDAYMHADLILRLAMVYSGGAEAARAPPRRPAPPRPARRVGVLTRCGVCVRGQQTWGLLRLPVAEVIAHGEHQVRRPPPPPRPVHVRPGREGAGL
jgi:hypothetical protein